MAIKIDVSEIKTRKACKRLWLFSSRNRYHLVPKAPAKALALGTLFHEALAQFYLGASYEAVMKLVKQEMTKDDAALLAMLKGYYDRVLMQDVEDWVVLDVEYRFDFPSGIGEGDNEVRCVGAIDLIVLNVNINTVYGVEHKTCSTFREAAFMWMDEQPRVYTKALEHWMVQAKSEGRIGEDAKLGGIYINEVKKLLRDFQYRRTLCTYEEQDAKRFWDQYLDELRECRQAILDADDGELPTPGYFACNMCAFKAVCASHGYSCIPKETILDDYGAEFRVRDGDHLDEKLDFGKRLQDEGHN